MTYSGMLHLLLLWTIAVLDFYAVEIYENEDLTLPVITFKVTSHTISMNIYICFKYLTALNQFFSLKYTLRSFIFKFDLNVKHHSYFLK